MRNEAPRPRIRGDVTGHDRRAPGTDPYGARTTSRNEARLTGRPVSFGHIEP